MDVERPVLAVGLQSPYALEKRLPREDKPAVAQQQRQQLKLLVGQRDWAAAVIDLTPRRDQAQRSGRQLR